MSPSDERNAGSNGAYRQAHKSAQVGSIRETSGEDKQSSLPLTKTNLQFHNDKMVHTQQGQSPMQRWLASVNDAMYLGRTSQGRKELCQQDALAADIEDIRGASSWVKD